MLAGIVAQSYAGVSVARQQGSEASTEYGQIVGTEAVAGSQCIFSVFLIKLTKFGCLLCLNGGSYGPENYFFWSRCGWTSG